jgi:putative ABC transport system permease protein
MLPDRVIRTFDRGCRALVRIAPGRAVPPWDADAAATLESVCAAAYRRRGLPGLVREGLLEWLDLARVVVRVRLGLTPDRPARRRQPARKDSHRMFRGVGHDVRQAVRGLLASRANAAVAVLTLALGIGVNSTAFSALDAALWHPVPFRDASHLGLLANYDAARKMSYTGMTRALLLEWRTQTDLFDRVEAYESASFVYQNPTGAEMTAGAVVTPGLISMLGVRPSLGRLFTTADGRAGTTGLALVSDRFWRTRLHHDAGVIGRRITLDGDAYAIVGVMPSDFRFPSESSDIWLPYNAMAPPPEGSGPQRQTASSTGLVPVIRLRADVARETAEAQVIARGARLSSAAGRSEKLSAELRTLDRGVDNTTKQALLVMGGAVGFLLLIVCANLANLALSRSLARARDYAVRAALGASRWMLVRQTFVENLLVAGAGAAGGLLTAALLLRYVVAVLPDDISASSFTALGIDGRVLLFTLGVSLLAGMVFGLPPALLASRASVSAMLGHQSRSVSGSKRARRVRGALVLVEVSLSIVLLVGASLMTRSLMKLYAADRGFDTHGLLALRLSLPAAGYKDAARRDEFTREAVARVRALPGVVAASASGALPPEMTKVSFGKIEVAGGAGPARDGPRLGAGEMVPLDEVGFVPLYEVEPGFFRTLGMTLEQGRTFGDTDGKGSVVVSESFARKYWPDGRAAGGRFRIGTEDWQTVIGVVGDVRRITPGASASQPQLYYRFGQPANVAVVVGPSSTIVDTRTILVRTATPGSVAGTLARAIHEVDPTVVVRRTDLVDHLFADTIARPRTIFLIMAVFAVFGLALAAAGLYGVLAHLVEQQQREIGIRLALGARPSDIGRRVVGSGLGLTLAGVVIGVGAALALVRVMRALLYEVDPSDPLSVTAVCAVLVGVALLAAWRPARRAMRVDPVALLRAE